MSHPENACKKAIQFKIFFIFKRIAGIDFIFCDVLILGLKKLNIITCPFITNSIYSGEKRVPIPLGYCPTDSTVLHRTLIVVVSAGKSGIYALTIPNTYSVIILLCVRLPSSNIRTKALLSAKFVVVLDSI